MERAGGEGTLRRAALPPGLLGELPRGPCWAPFNTRQLGLVQMSGRHCLDCILITILHSLPNARPLVHNKCSGHLIITWNALPCISFSIFCLPMRLQGFCTRGLGSCTLHHGDSPPQRHMLKQGICLSRAGCECLRLQEMTERVGTEVTLDPSWEWGRD